MADLVYTRTGRGLIVAEAAASEQAITRALKQLSDRLFLERHLQTDGQWVWTVQEHVGERAGGRSPFRTVLYWTDQQNDPLPLTWRIVDRVKELEGDGAERMAAAQRSQEEWQARKEAELDANLETAALDVARSMQPGHSPLLFRSQGLRIARDKERARGRKR